MKIGVPKELKNQEYRVGLTPDAVKQYCDAGHTVLVECGAGLGSGFTDAEYRQAGAQLHSQQTIWDEAELVVKIKEPLVSEYQFFRPGLIIYTYLHLAANLELTKQLLTHKVTAIAYETVQLADGSLPLLAPMSEVAGRMAVQVGAHFLEAPTGGRGVLLSGIPGVSKGEVVIIGGGVVGMNAAIVAVGLGAKVSLFDVSAPRLREIDAYFGGRIQTCFSSPTAIAQALRTCDLLIGAVLIPGASAPKVVSRAMIALMPKGSVVVDVAIDQGGCIETITQATTHEQPTFEVDGVIHYAVANIPGAVPRTSTIGLVNVTTPYGLALATLGVEAALARYPQLQLGLMTHQGVLYSQPVVQAHQLKSNG